MMDDDPPHTPMDLGSDTPMARFLRFVERILDVCAYAVGGIIVDAYGIVRRIDPRFALLLAIMTVGDVGKVGAQLPQRLPAVRVENDGVDQRPNTWPDSLRRAVLDSLAAGRGRWRATRPSEYRLAVFRPAGMMAIEIPPGPIPGVRVRDDSLAEAVELGRTATVRYGEWLRFTIDSVFAEVEAAARDRTYQVDALQLDPVYGFPRRWHVNDVHNGWGNRTVHDRGYGGAVERFSAAEDLRPCAWWRRMLRRCGVV
jgi:hypothetical protein